MTKLNSESSYLCIDDLIMKENDCCFEFGQFCAKEEEKQLLSINNDKPPGINNLNGEILRMVADCITTPFAKA